MYKQNGTSTLWGNGHNTSMLYLLGTRIHVGLVRCLSLCFFVTDLLKAKVLYTCFSMCIASCN